MRCTHLKHTTSRTKSGLCRCLFYLFEVDIRLIGDSCLMHCLCKIFRLSKTPSLNLANAFRLQYILSSQNSVLVNAREL
jgi:hypothetical protein